MNLRTAALLAAVCSPTLWTHTATAKKPTPEEECAKYKPDRTVSSQEAQTSSGSVGGRYLGISAQGNMEKNSQERMELQELPEDELERQATVYRACLAHKSGDLEDAQWQRVLSASLGLKGGKQGKAPRGPAPRAKAKGQAVQLVAAAQPCGRFAGFGLHVPKRYTRKVCKDEAGKARFVFTAPQGKGGTCKALGQWATGNGYHSEAKSSSPAKDEMVFTKAGLPNMTVKCVNFPKDSGKPTRLVFMLDQ